MAWARRYTIRIGIYVGNTGGVNTRIYEESPWFLSSRTRNLDLWERTNSRKGRGNIRGRMVNTAIKVSCSVPGCNKEGEKRKLG